jgi:arylsulfatase
VDPLNDPEALAATASSDRHVSTGRPYRDGAPNVVVIVLDDTGFAQLGCYGSDIATPNIDALAGRGVQLTNFHTTAICSPTRACLLTGRNHHRVGMGMLPDLPMAFPGYTARIPDEAGTLAQVLRSEGYATFAVGKWHLTPRDERGPSGPFDRWPIAKGFEHHYGFLAGDANHWAPELVRDHSFVDPPRTPEEGYHLSEDLADEAITRVRELRRNQPQRPFMLWLALGASHAPHHVAPEWSDPYSGSFDDGWEAWRRRVLARQVESGVVAEGVEVPSLPDYVPDWDALPPEERHLYARMMEVYAGFLTHADAQIGRVLDALDELGERDDTIVVLVSDNGSSGEAGPHGSVSEYRFAQGRGEDLELNLRRIDDLGGPKVYNHYPWGWAEAGNTPARRFKRYTFEGGVRDPCIVSWPGGLPDGGGLRHQYCHAIDVMPTLLDLAGVEMPDVIAGVPQMSLDGVSLRSMLESEGAVDPRTSQYYECWGSRAMYEDGWKVVTDHVSRLTDTEHELIPGSDDFSTDRWLLFDTHADPAECRDLSEDHPEIRDRLVARWHEEAERNGVLPLSDGILDRLSHLFLPWPSGSTKVDLRPGERVFEDNVPGLSAGFEATAHLRAPLPTGSSGVIAEQGDYNGGWVWYSDGARLCVVVSFVSEYETHLEVDLPVGATELRLVGRPVEGSMELELQAEGQVLGGMALPHPWPGLWSPNSSATLIVGVGRPSPVCDGYDPLRAFDGGLERLEIVSLGAGLWSGDTEAIDHQVETTFRSQ